MDSIIKTKSETLSFLDLIAKKEEIIIPLIQRDYAQGRTSAKAAKVRKDFVNELYTKIIGGTPLSLDFIYGTTDGGKFIPLDGQQRLTTLFLLHLYLEGLALSQFQDAPESISPLAYRFSYETRDSSKRFCKAIINHRAEIFDKKELSKIIKLEVDGKEKEVLVKPSMIIKDQSWWFGIWDSDPTISGMLNMLDEIHTVFFDKASNAYEALFKSEEKVVSFQFMPLEEFYDPDDLYIKMNARGLPLTPYEIFKSRFYSDLEATLGTFEVKEAKSNIDVRYTDFLWPLRSEGMKNIDIYFQRIFKLLIVAEHVAISQVSDEKWLDYLFEANYKTCDFSHNQFIKMGVSFSKGLIDRIMADLELLCSPTSPLHKLREDAAVTEWINFNNIWKEMVLEDSISKPGYRQRLELHALLRFVGTFKNANLNAELPVWTRLIHNLAESSPLDNSSRMASALRNIDYLIESLKAYNNALDVNDWISANMSLSSKFFAQFQWQEEVVKAHLRKDAAWEQQISKAEHNRYLNGEIGITLWLAGVITSGDNKSFSPDGLLANDIALNVYKSYLNKSLPLLDEIAANGRIVKKHTLVRAMLVKGDYMPWMSSGWRKNIYNQPNHRDYSWKTLWRINNGSHKVALSCLKAILDDHDYNPASVNASLERISAHRLPQNTPIWRRLLTSNKGHDILTHSNQGFIAFIGDEPDYNKKNVLIYGSSQRNGWHGELSTLYLFYILKQKGYNPSYCWRKDSESDYGLSFKDKAGDTISIYYWDGNWYLSDDKKPEFTNLSSLICFLSSKLI